MTGVVESVEFFVGQPSLWLGITSSTGELGKVALLPGGKVTYNGQLTVNLWEVVTLAWYAVKLSVTLDPHDGPNEMPTATDAEFTSE
jgi:hypothetical protein